MAEFLTSNPYSEIEQDIVNESIDRFLTSKTATSKVSVSEDPRVAATEAMAKSVGFSLEAGQYVDLIR